MIHLICTTVWAELLDKLPVDHPMVVSVLVTCVTAVLGALFTFLGVILKFILNVDRAVNNRASHEPKLYDLVMQTREQVEQTREQAEQTQEQSRENTARLVRVERDTRDLVAWKEGFQDRDVPLRTGEEAEQWIRRDEEWKGTTEGRLTDLERDEVSDRERLDSLEARDTRLKSNPTDPPEKGGSR